MGYPGRKYRQETGQSLPGQGYSHQGLAPQGSPYDGHGGPMGGHSSYYQPPPQSYNQFPIPGAGQQPMNQAFPMPGFMPMPGGMPIPVSGMPMPGGGPSSNNGFSDLPPPPYSNMPSQHSQAPSQNLGGFPHQTHFNAPPHSQYPLNQPGDFGHPNSFNAPPPTSNQQLYNQPPIVQQAPPSQPLPPGVDPSVSVSNFSGRKKAVLIGINYFGTNAELRGCINDVKNVKDFICRHYGFSSDSMVILTDDQTSNPTRMPTRANIIQAMYWLTSDARPNDSLFFHFSGHGSQQEDQDGDEEDGSDETICPLDYATAGEIVDDEMNSIMVRPLPQGCRLTAIFDCCHSGTALDLPYTYNQDGKLVAFSPTKSIKNVVTDLGKKYLMGDMVGAMMSLKRGLSGFKGKNAQKVSEETRGTLADVVMFSGCKDCQTSADAVEQGVGNTGAMSFALIKALSNNPHGLTYLQLLSQVRGILEGKYTQVPQLSSGRPMDMNSIFNM